MEAQVSYETVMSAYKAMLYNLISTEYFVKAVGKWKVKLLLCRTGIGELLKYINALSLWINLLKPTAHVMHSTTVRSAHNVFMCFVFIWEQTMTCATYSINWLVFITEMKSVYCAVRTGSLNKPVCASYLKG